MRNACNPRSAFEPSNPPAVPPNFTAYQVTSRPPGYRFLSWNLQIQKTNDGKYLAAVGKETFDVEIKLSLADGKILSATIDNPVQTIERECEDAALTKCGDPRPHPIRRQIELTLQP